MFLKLHEPNLYQKWLLTIEDRYNIDSSHYNALQQYKSGIEGETQFYELVRAFEIPMIWDITLNLKGEAQYDFIFVVEKQIIHFDVKNYTGHYHYKNGNFISQKGYVHQGLISQLERAHQKLDQFIQRHQLKYKVKSMMLFINDTFILNGGHHDQRIILPPKINHVVPYLSRLSSTEEDLRVAELLLQCHQPSMHKDVPTLDYTTITKGVRCKQCGGIGLFKSETQRTMTCICGNKIRKSEYIHQAMADISILKHTHFTNAELSEYTGISPHTLKHHLNKKCSKTGTFKDAKYLL